MPKLLLVIFAIALSCWSGMTFADAPKHGLMWNRSGLPAVFPLQVKTLAGQNYYVELTDAQSGAPAMAAFIEGGRFFKVLVPPGEFDVFFASGKTWEDEESLFGTDGTDVFRLEKPLKFEVLGASVKAGHIIDLTNMPSEIVVAGSFICQRVAVSRWPRPQEPFDDTEGYATRLTDSGELVEYPNRYAQDRLLAGTVEPTVPTDFAPYSSAPQFEVREIPCR
jgi:hypothetical protein